MTRAYTLKLVSIINQFYKRPEIISVLFSQPNQEALSKVSFFCVPECTRAQQHLLRDEFLNSHSGITVSFGTQPSLSIPHPVEEQEAFIDFLKLLGEYIINVKRIHSQIEGYRGMTWTPFLSEFYTFIDVIQLVEFLEMEREAGNFPVLSPFIKEVSPIWTYISACDSGSANVLGLQIISADLEPRRVLDNIKELEKLTSMEWFINPVSNYCYPRHIGIILDNLREQAKNLFLSSNKN